MHSVRPATTGVQNEQTMSGEKSIHKASIAVSHYLLQAGNLLYCKWHCLLKGSLLSPFRGNQTFHSRTGTSLYGSVQAKHPAGEVQSFHQ
eukprot:6482744-Amphidinium_carterae.1